MTANFAVKMQRFLKKILRDLWHYDGVTISDWGGVHNTEKTALNGVDMEMSVTPDFDDYKLANPLLEKVKSGKIDESVIDKRIERILTMMERIKLGDKTRNKGCTNTKDHQQTIQQIAEEGIVLLKNDTALSRFPRKQRKILVLGGNAKRTHAAGGGSAETKHFMIFRHCLACVWCSAVMHRLTGCGLLRDNRKTCSR